MIHEEQTDRLIAFLNELLAIDQDCISILMRSRVTCNDAMVNHPTVQVGVQGKSSSALSVLGLLNGFCGVYDDGLHRSWGPITAVSEDGLIQRFERTEPKRRSRATTGKSG